MASGLYPAANASFSLLGSDADAPAPIFATKARNELKFRYHWKLLRGAIFVPASEMTVELTYY
jgi:hypothetical protein